MEHLLPVGEDEHPMYVERLVILYSFLLPFSEVEKQNKDMLIHHAFRPQRATDEIMQQINEYDDEKRVLFAEMSDQFHKTLGSILLPKFFDMYKQNIDK